MTRINLVPVQELSNQHLLAELREIVRIPNLILKGKYNMESIPEIFVLGKGHVAFFYDKLEFLYNRYCKLIAEACFREFQVDSKIDSFIKAKRFNQELNNDYTPTNEDIEKSRERIFEKLKMKPKFYKWKYRTPPIYYLNIK